MGLDEFRKCKGTGRKVCTCTSFAKCISCDQEYATSSLRNGKCPACNTLQEERTDRARQTVESIKVAYPAQAKTSKWLFGANALNSVAIAKGFLSDTLYVVEDGRVIFQKSISFLNKIRGR